MSTIIVAMNKQYLIGTDGHLPNWNLMDDFKAFVKETIHNVVIMGRKTWDSIPESRRPLRERINVVITSRVESMEKKYSEGVFFTDSLRRALNYVDMPFAGKVFVIGGAQIYKEALPICDEMIITWVDAPRAKGDIYFPEFDLSEWEKDPKEIKIEKGDRNSHNATICRYQRRTLAVELADSTYARTPEYKKALDSFVDEGECPLCPNKFESGEYHTNPMLRQLGPWVITRNMNKYENAEEHFLIVPWRHMTEYSELSPEDFIDIQRLVSWAQKEYKLPAGTLAVRFGDTRYTGATVVHLHFHLIIPKFNREKGRGETVLFPIG